MTETKHDGLLSAEGTRAVRFAELTDGQVVEIEDPFYWLWLKPKQALSLLAWLEQEKSKLEQLVKEQAE